MSADSVRVVAPAKVNLYLAVGGRRPDGYHDVTTVLAALDLADTLMLQPAGALVFECTRDLDIPPEENLVVKAVRRLAAHVGREPDVAIHLDKHIPDGAGLGGGSSDAAAAIVGLAKLWGLDLAPDELAKLASELGSDVPFFLRGGMALYEGRGDRLARELSPRVLDIALVRPDERVPTGAAYAAFDRILQPAAPGVDSVLDAVENGDVGDVAAALYNNMTEPSCGLVASVGEALAWMRGAPGVMGAAMAGSGSAVFGVCQSPDDAQACADLARERGWWSVATQTVPDGVRSQMIGGGA